MAVLSAYFDLGTSVRRIAEYAGMFSDADLFEIQPLMPYTEEDLDADNPKSRSCLEQGDVSSRPQLIRMPGAYDTVLLGFPLWLESEPRVIDTFLSQLPAGTHVIPFTNAAGKEEEISMALSSRFPLLKMDPVAVVENDPAAIGSWIRSLSLQDLCHH